MKKYKYSSCLTFIISVLLISCNVSNDKNLISYVDPYIGADGHGHVFVGASTPFGMIQVGPQNIHKGWDWCSGYHYSDSVIIGFAHTHLSGTGCTDLGDIQFMPFSGEIRTKRGEQNDISGSVASYYSHTNEIVAPNYYSLLMDNGIKVELTASERVALHHYTFASNENNYVLINLKEGNGDRSEETYIKQLDEYTIEGYRFSRGWSTHRVYFAMKSKQPISDLLVYSDDVSAGNKSLKGSEVKGVIVFKDNITNAELKVAISSVSCENALLNLETEVPHWDFDKVKEDTAEKWNSELSRMLVETDSEADKRIFYTAMYHTAIAPTLYADVNNEFRGHDNKIYKADTWTNYSTFSLWDTYRALHPLFTITQYDKVDDMVNSMLSIYDQQNKLPIWPLIGGETNTMPGYSAIPVITDAYLKGYKGFDAERAFMACEKSATYAEQRGVREMMSKGFISCDTISEGISLAMEYAVGDGGIARMAKKMGKEKEYKFFENRSLDYKQYFDPDTKFARPKRADGTFITPYNPVISKHEEGLFCEGNGWQYTFFVPHHPEGLIEIQGGDQQFITKLDEFFSIEQDMGPDASMDITGLIGQYAHGNEPSHHIAFLYAYAGEQWRTAEKSRYIINNFYSDKPDGIIGNEDCGQMSAWYLLASMGMYQVNPSDGNYVFGSPMFDKVTIKLAEEKTFEITTENNSKENIYIQSILLNGKEYLKSYINYSDIVKGGKLHFKMGDQPNKSFGSDRENRPISNY